MPIKVTLPPTQTLAALSECQARADADFDEVRVRIAATWLENPKFAQLQLFERLNATGSNSLRPCHQGRGDDMPAIKQGADQVVRLDLASRGNVDQPRFRISNRGQGQQPLA